MNKTEQIIKPKYSQQEINACIALLEDLVANSAEMAHLSDVQKVALLKTTGQISRPNREEGRKRHKDRTLLKKTKIDHHERGIRAATGIRSARDASVFCAPHQVENGIGHGVFQDLQLIRPRDCYICKAPFTQVHFFYDSLCPDCAVFNYAKRFQTVSLKGQIALITGSRLKIGYQAALAMLRAGAHVIATTRFPIDSALRYAQEKDGSLKV